MIKDRFWIINYFLIYTANFSANEIARLMKGM